MLNDRLLIIKILIIYVKLLIKLVRLFWVYYSYN